VFVREFRAQATPFFSVLALALDVPFLRWGIVPTIGGVVSKRSKWTKIILASAAMAALCAATGFAQTATTDEGKRKVRSRVAPTYPELAKRMSVTGKVKIEVIIAPDGHVKSTRAIGGHPLLVQSCTDAVKEWKFFPAPEETTQVVEFDFTGSSN
jgi:TonB family protein